MTDTAYQTLRIEREGTVARLVMNRPDKLNSFDHTLRMEMIAAVAAVNGDPALRVIILSGEGRAFSAGADLADGFGPEADARGAATEHQLKTEYKPSLLGIVESPKPAEPRPASAAPTCWPVTSSSWRKRPTFTRPSPPSG